MAKTDFLTEDFEEITPVPEYLKVKSCLGEFDDSQKITARLNLEVPSIQDVISPSEVEKKIAEAILNAFNKYLGSEDPPITLEIAETIVREALTNYVPKTDLESFIKPAKDYTILKLKDHVREEDPHSIIPAVLDILTNYVKLSEVYGKDRVYTKDEVDSQSSQYIKKDGSVPFSKPLIGVDPKTDSHLSTKRYVDNLLYEHLMSVDPHGLITILNNRLSSYVKKKDVFDKTETYSRTQIDTVINNIVELIVENVISDYKDSVDDKFEYIRKLYFVKLDGSTPFRTTLKGVDAVEPNDLVTLQQLKNVVEEAVSGKEMLWVTSGPVESTVGHVEDNTPVPDTMTFQEIMDAIFYGKGISISVPEYVQITKSCPVTLCVKGSAGLIEHAELWQDDELIYTFDKNAFDDGCITVDSLPILKDTEFTFKVYYTNGTSHEETALVKCAMPVFVGLLPEWEFGNTLTMARLIQLEKEDEEGTLNRFINCGDDVKSITFKYVFKDHNLRHPFIVLPANYPDLESMVTKSLSFGIEAFNFISMIPMQIKGVDGSTIFKMYIYEQALSNLNLEVTFNFKPVEE